MNYSNLARAVEHYVDRGYVYLDDVPWVIDKPAYDATKPAGAVIVDMTAGMNTWGHPVASGEQGFIQMMLNGQPVKRAVCVTPCFRFEPRVDMLHRQYFMKVELINAQDTDRGHLIHMVHDACSFFENYFPVRVVETSDGFDVVEKTTRFELGSYGIRDMYVSGRHLRWVYGTGCAEPRLSTAIQKFARNGGR